MGGRETRGRKTSTRAVLKRAALPATLVALLAVQVLLILYFEPPGIVLSTTPASRGDLDTHITQVWRVTEALDGWGEPWAYDVQLLAGVPTGTIFDADNKGWEIWTYGLWKMGVPRGLAFNLFILMVHLLVPWSVLAAARQMRLGWWPSVVAAALALALWYFDTFPHRVWWIGMNAYGFVGYFGLLPLALLYRWVRDGGWWRAVCLAVALAWAHLVHPYAFVILVVPMAVVWGMHARKMGWRRHLGVVAAAAFTLAVNAYWLIVAFRYWHYILDSGYFGQSTVAYILTDYLALMGDTDVTGYMGNRTGFRVLTFAAAAVTFVLWWRKKDDRFWPLAAGVGVMLALTYLGGYFWVTRQVQPYRHIMPAAFLAIIPAAAFVTELMESRALAKIPRLAWAAAAIVMVTALPYLARDVLFFIPHLLPPVHDRSGANLGVEQRMSLDNLARPRKHAYRRGPPSEGFDDVARWVEINTDGSSGRILVERGFLGEHLAWKTDAQILGGFRKRNLKHSAANLFREHPDGRVTDAELAQYIETYAVEWIIISEPKPMERPGGLLVLHAVVAPNHRIYRTPIEASYFQEGSGKLEASMNRIAVTGSDPDVTLVLRYHWMETLVCEPDCAVERSEVPGNPVGFIRVPAPHPADLEILNGY